MQENMQSTMENLLKRIIRLNSIVELSQAINSNLNSDNILDILAFTCLGRFMSDGAIIYLTDRLDVSRLVLEREKGTSLPYAFPAEIMTAETVSVGAKIWTSKGEPPPPEMAAFIESLHPFRPAVVSAICSRELFLGYLALGGRPEGEVYDEADLEYVSTVSLIAGTAIENARLYELATFDQKTGLFMYHSFKSRIQFEIARSKRSGRGFSLVMADLDHFKKVNDEYGHDAGDTVLSHMGAIIRSGVRAIDIAARFGGEEFLILCAEASAEEAEALTQRLQAEIRTHAFPTSKGDIRVTASFGISGFNPELPSDLETLLKEADQALYLSKNNGRDRITVFSA